MGTFTETSTAPDQAVVAVNLGEQGPSSVSEGVVLPDLTTKNQHIVGNVVSSDRDNGKKSRKPTSPEFIILSDVLWARVILQCEIPCTDLKL